MKINIKHCLAVAFATVSLLFTACEDETSGIGNSISSSEITISIDSIYYNLDARTIEAPAFESRSYYGLLGSVSVPEYGDLQCSYVTQFLPSETLNIPDTIKSNDIDSVKMILTVPKTYLTGDSLAPQQMSVYRLTKQLPEDISSSFNPEGYYNPTDPMVRKSYTLSGYTYNDSTFVNSRNVKINARLPQELGVELFEKYQKSPEIFVWPEKFAEYWPGVYVTPSFGKGCIAPVQSTGVYLYFPKTIVSKETDDNGETQLVYTQVADSICVLSNAPEVLSNVNISYKPSDNLRRMISEGRNIVTTPGGFTVSFNFPVKEILKEYWAEEYDLGVINNMIFSLPASLIRNAYGLGMPPALLMVKTSDLNSYFADGKLPDNKNSFYSIFSSEDNSYTFSSMRDYIVALKEKGESNITEEDTNFTLIPVNVTTEDYTDPSTGILVTQVTSTTPYIIQPTMMELDTKKALIIFTYSNQILN